MRVSEFIRQEAERIQIDLDELRDDSKWLSANSIQSVVAILEVGDGVHPRHGVGYMGPEWEKLDEPQFDAKRYRRNTEANQIRKQVVEALKLGVAEANLVAKSTPHQIFYIASEFDDLLDSVAVIETAYGPNEWAEQNTLVHGNVAAIWYYQHYSYFIRDW